MIGRIVIDDVRPATPHGYPAKAVIGEQVPVSADVFRDGHDILAARVRWRPVGEKKWTEAPLTHVGNDRWEGVIEPSDLGRHELVVDAWTDRYETWRHDIGVKWEVGQPSAAGSGNAEIELELEEGALLLAERAKAVPAAERRPLKVAADALRDRALDVADRIAAALDPQVADVLNGVPDKWDLTSTRPQPLWVDRERALFGAWYEFFPRSEGGLGPARKRLSAVAEMGFDVVYVPPVHPIGRTHRKGRNNKLVARSGDPGSPWAIGSPDGGHTAIEPSLGTLADFDAFVTAANDVGMEVALDYALQCSPDHPWVADHPEWFHRRPDGSIKYAENPPKKYQDIYPINFWPADAADREALWLACKEILDFWIGHGIRIFRVDNPHTKPLAFWEWLIPAVQDAHPDVVFLAEAFTMPKMMARLAEVGFSQSYTYFTWRDTKWELREYVEEVALSAKADFMRPNFWPNTPDILAGPLRNGPTSAFRMRLVLAAFLVPSYGMYSGYELCENEPQAETNEEYLNPEKYEVKDRDWDAPGSMAPLVTRINDIRHRHSAFWWLRNIEFHHSENDQILVWSKRDGADVMLVVVNLDLFSPQEDTVWLDLHALGIPPDVAYEAYDELTGDRYVWRGANNYVRLDPAVQPAHVFALKPL